MRALLLCLLFALPATAAPVRLCIVGNSIAAGFSPATAGVSVPIAALDAGTNFGVKNVAHSGDKVAAAQLLFTSDVVGRGCTWVAFLIGTNNLPDGTSAADIYAPVDVMMDAAEAGGSRVLGLALLPRGAGASYTLDLGTRLVAFNALLAARTSSVAARPYVYVDTYTALTGTCAATASAPAWAASTAYSLGNVRVANSRAYVVTTAGTSAGSGGPTGTGTGIVDGTVTWAHAPALASAAGGATDGLHPNNDGQSMIAAAVQAAVVAAGGW